MVIQNPCKQATRKGKKYLFLKNGSLRDPLSITWTTPQAVSANLKKKSIIILQ